MARIARLDAAQLVAADQIGLVEQDHVGKADLFLRLGAVGKALHQVLGVGHGDHGIELGPLAHIVVHEEGLRHRHRIGQARGLHQDAVEAARPLHQPLDDADQVAAHRAAHAAIVHLEDFLVALDDEVVVDVDLAELVDDDGVFLAVVLGQDTVEERGLAGAEIAGEHRDGDLVFRHRGVSAAGQGRRLAVVAG